MKEGELQLKQPGEEHLMMNKPNFENASAPGQKLKDKVAIITGGDSGIGKAVAIAFAKEGAHVAIIYLDEDDDARFTKQAVEAFGVVCLPIKKDVGVETNCQEIVREVIHNFKRLDIVVNNAGVQYPQDHLEDITEEQLEHTFKVNVFSHFFLCKAALPHLKCGASIVNTTSVTAYQGCGFLMDYAATKGAIVAFTRSLSASLIHKGIRVNGVAPGPVWTPLIPASFKEVNYEDFGKSTPMGRAGQPHEIAGCYVFLASEDAAYMTGQVLHPNGGSIVNG